MKKRNERRTDRFFDNAASWVRIAGKIGQMVVLIRGKPRTMDYLAVAAGALEVAVDVRQQSKKRHATEAIEVRDWLRSTDWAPLEGSFRRAVLSQLCKPRLLPEEDLPDLSGRVVEAEIDGELFRWPAQAQKLEDQELVSLEPPRQDLIWYRRERSVATMDAIASSVWAAMQTNALTYDGQTLEPSSLPTDSGLETDFFRATKARCERFLAIGRSRGILLNGAPGTGKSSCVRKVLHALSLRVLHVQLAALDELFYERHDGPPNVDTMLRMLRPDAMVIDDVDRVEESSQPELLALMEVAMARCKLVFVTTNDSSRLIAPLVRPGRLDDLLEVPPLEPEVIQALLGPEDEDLAPEMANWPIAYIRDYVDRREALGRSVARSEVEALGRRVEMARTAEEEASGYLDRLVANHSLHRSPPS